MTNILKGHIALFIAQIVYALNYSIAKDLMPTYIGPIALVFLRIFGACILFWILSLFLKTETVAKKDLIKMLWLALFGIVINQVFFAYPSRPEKIVLKGIDISVSPGERIALVGMSGAGKSTLTQLLMQFYKADKGEIFIDDFPINKYDLSDVRGNMAIVPQDVMLFGGSIKDNIAYGNPSASDSDIMEAAKKANAWEFIEGFPSKMETIVGERGVKLSGGQKQRVAIARAILKDPAILILDEATSSLDAESERLVQEALQLLMVGRTSIIIAHRLATIKDVNQIYVLENGTIAEKGTHQELLQNENGLYTSLAKLQFEY